MKKIVFVLLAAVLMLSAVEWDTEQITAETEYDCYSPILALDNDGNLRILYTHMGSMNTSLKLASNAAGPWDTKEVAEVSPDFWRVYGLDVDADGHSFVVYMDMVSEELTDVFLAADTGGDFVSTNVTDDPDFQAAPTLTLDNEGIPHLLYAQAPTPGDNIQVYHGWVSGEGFLSEPITENLYQEDFTGYDLVFDQMGIPHVFYIGDDTYLWHAVPGELLAWIPEKLNELSSEWPSAVADPLGSFHVAYDVGEESIHYITNMTGTWQDELVSDGGDPGGGNWRPCLDMDKVWGQFFGIGNPHIVWVRADADWWYDLWYAGKATGTWIEEAINPTPEKDEAPGYGPYFKVDVEGYGHLVYCAEDEEFVTQIYYAKSTEPLSTAIAERPPQLNPLCLEVRGSALHFSLPASGTIRLDLYDASGRLVSNLTSGNFEAGDHSVPLNTAGLASGMYFIRAEIAERSANAKFVLTK